MSFDPVTYAMAKAYSDKKGGYVEPGKVYTFNGDTTGLHIVVSNDIQYVRISTEHTDPDTIARIVVSLAGSMLEFTKTDMRIVWNSAHTAYTVFVPFGELEAPIINGTVDGDAYLDFVADPNYNAFVARLEFAETLHPIDPKFLPGVCLPVVELETACADGTALSAADNAKLREAAESGLPIVCKFSYAENTVVSVFITLMGDGATSFIVNLAGQNFVLSYAEETNGWFWTVA